MCGFSFLFSLSEVLFSRNYRYFISVSWSYFPLTQDPMPVLFYYFKHQKLLLYLVKIPYDKFSLRLFSVLLLFKHIPVLFLYYSVMIGSYDHIPISMLLKMCVLNSPFIVLRLIYNIIYDSHGC